MERRRWWRRIGHHHRRRRAAEKFLVGYAQEKVVVVEKIRPEDQNGDRGQLKRPLKTAGAKT